MIRWGGIGGFVAVVALVLVISHFFVDHWIKAGIESMASDAAGSEVNVGSVSHSYSPLGLTIRDIQVTDAVNPATNQVQLAQVSANLEVSPLMLRKVVISELTADGVKFNQPRKKPGKVFAKDDSEKSEAADKSADFGDDIKLPSVDEILARSPLQTQQAISDTREFYQTNESALKSGFDALPDDAKLKSYEEKIKALTDKEYKTPEAALDGQKQLKALKDQLRQEQKKIQSFSQSVKDASSGLKASMADLKAAKDRDFDLLKGLVAGDAAAFGQVTEMLFGEKAKVWSGYLFSAYDLVVPLLKSSKEEKEEQQRATGRWVTFADTQTLPDLLIRKARFDLEWDGQGFSSDWQDITYQHQKLGRPTLYKVASTQTPKWSKLLVDGQFQLLDSGLTADQVWDLAGVAMSAQTLSSANRLSASLEKANLTSTGKLSIRDNTLDGSGLINFAQLAIASSGEGKIATQVASALEKLKAIDMKASLGGTLDSPDFSLGSDLDEQIRKMLAANITAEGQKKMDELKSRLNTMAEKELGPGGAKLTEWQQWQDLADGRSESITKMLQTEVSNRVDSEKSKLEDKLKGKLFN